VRACVRMMWNHLTSGWESRSSDAITDDVVTTDGSNARSMHC